MLNHCGNKFIIFGFKKDRDIIKNKLECDDTLVNFHQMRKKQDNIAIDLFGFNRGGWGTKWNSYECQLIEHNDERTEYIYLTAWSPPYEDMIKEFMANYPLLTYEYYYAEKGAGFYGYHATGVEGYLKYFQHCDFVEKKSNANNSDSDEYEFIDDLVQFTTIYNISG